MVILIKSTDTVLLDQTAKILMDRCQGYAVPLPNQNGKAVRKIVGEQCNLDVMVSDSIQMSIKS